MEEIVEKVSAAPYVTVMDLSKGYFQIPLTPRAQRYAAFVTPFGTYIPKKMMFGTIASPLTDALKGKIKKEKITWDEKCGKAFEELKAKLVTQPILFAPDFATEFILQTDASECCMKGILETGGVMGQCVQLRTRNYGALDQTARVFWRVMRQ
ncbi:retrovirus-related Pol polyprotein from transposon 297 [Trichonephila clavipes]|nr:retrovirus-related Pol polyprotein from transposon 297 [Trichonephila clavipes]